MCGSRHLSIYWTDRCLHAYDFMSTYVFEVLFENVFCFFFLNWIYAFLRGDKKTLVMQIFIILLVSGGVVFLVVIA